MSPPLLSSGEESDVTRLASSSSMESVCQNSVELKERNYMGLSDCSSVDSSKISITTEDNNVCLNLKATELSLGLPGSQSPKRDLELCLLNSAKHNEKPFFSLGPPKDGDYLLSPKAVVSGNKRGFSDTMDAFPEGKFRSNSEVNVSVMSSPRPSNLGLKEMSSTELATNKESMPRNKAQEKPLLVNEKHANDTNTATSDSNTPATKAQVVGWPPIKSYRKSTLGCSSKNTDGKTRAGVLFVKVSMDGAPYLRKVDLKTYSAYQELSSALEKMFSCFTIGREMLTESKLKDLLHGSEYVLTYEDKDGDWMLVGDVPWEMFIETCKRMRIMKSSDAIGLAPRAVEKGRSKN